MDGSSEEHERDGLIYVGRIEKLKGTDVLIDAWKLMGANAPRLTICGTGPMEAWCREQIKENGLNRKCLKLEVTESAYTENPDQLLAVMEQLRHKGYEIEMDDFGSGYSSLGTLSTLPVDILKMDRSFVMHIDKNEKDLRLVELILDIAKNLKLPVIAEGVETEKQLTLLKNAGCEYVQGYYFSRPVPPEEFEEFIKRARMVNTDIKAFV